VKKNTSNSQQPLKEKTVSSYSELGSKAYEDPMNKNFLYGNLTIKFLRQTTIHPNEKQILDIGPGTGFVFDILYEKLMELECQGLGIEPAQGMREIAIEKYKNPPSFSFSDGSFENIPLENCSVDKIDFDAFTSLNTIAELIEPTQNAKLLDSRTFLNPLLKFIK
jgi:ubiquinone/menaquinone biosynthesis C-methylase UbiE